MIKKLFEINAGDTYKKYDISIMNNNCEIIYVNFKNSIEFFSFETKINESEVYEILNYDIYKKDEPLIYFLDKNLEYSFINNKFKLIINNKCELKKEVEILYNKIIKNIKNKVLSDYIKN